MADTELTDLEEEVKTDKNDEGNKDVEIFDDDNREEEDRQYLQDIDYDYDVISEKIKEKKKILKQKFDDLKKQSAPLYSHETCKQLFDRIDKPSNSAAIGIMQQTEVANYLTELRHKKDRNKIDYIDRIFLERVNLTEENIPTEEGDRQQILGKIRDEFKQLGFHIDDSSGIKGANLLEFIEFMNKDKKNHSKEILLLNEIIDIALEKIKYEIVHFRLKGIKGTILILKANIKILNFFKKFLDKLQQANIKDIISDFEKDFEKEFIPTSKSKIDLEYQDVSFEYDAIESLYDKDKDVLVDILKKQAQELLNTISYMKKDGNYDTPILQQVSSIVQQILIPEQKATLTTEVEAEGKKDATQLAIVKSTEDEAMEEDADVMQQKIDELDTQSKKKLEKILGILQDFIYTECINVIKPSLADSIFTLKLSSIKKNFEIEVQIQKLIEDTNEKYITDKYSREQTPFTVYSATQRDDGMQPSDGMSLDGSAIPLGASATSGDSSASASATQRDDGMQPSDGMSLDVSGGKKQKQKKKKSKKGEILTFKF